MFGGIPIAESVAVTWVIMAILVILSLILVRNLKVENPGKKQLLLESGVSFLQDFFVGILGEEGKRYCPIAAPDWKLCPTSFIGQFGNTSAAASISWQNVLC